MGRSRGYVYVWFGLKRKQLHRVLAETYIPNPLNLPQVGHLNSDRGDYRLENLEWCDQTRNEEVKIKSGRATNRRFDRLDLYEINHCYNNLHLSTSEIAFMFQTGRGVISKILKGTSYKYSNIQKTSVTKNKFKKELHLEFLKRLRSGEDFTQLYKSMKIPTTTAFRLRKQL